MGTSFGKVVSFEGRKYRVVSEIGRGRYASIVMVKDMQTNTEYALKRSVVKNSQSELQSIARHEATLLGTLPPHRYIVKSCGYKQRPQPNDSTEHLLLLEYCTGGNLYEQLGQAQRPWSLNKILTCFSSVAQAVKHLHSQRPGVTHRDIRLENVLIDHRGYYKLCDFGSSTKEIWTYSTLVDMEAMEDIISKRTSSHWRAPEMVNLRKWKRVGPEVDVWALGVMFFHLLFLKAPFGRSSRIPKGEYVVPEHPSYPRTAIRLLRRMLEVNPSKRATIDEVLKSIREICMSTPEDEHKSKDTTKRTVPEKPSIFTHSLGRATSSQLGPPKAKHVRKLIVTAWQQDDPAHACSQLFDEIVSRGERNDAVIVFKTLQTIHKLMQQGPIEILREACRTRESMYQGATKRFPSSTNKYLDKGLQEILPVYADYLHQRSELHHYFPMIEGNFSISVFVQGIRDDEGSFDVKKWNLKTFEAINRMFELSFKLKELGDMALVGLFAGGRSDAECIAANEFRESVIIPVIDDINAIFLTSTYLLGLLRVSMGRQRIQRLLLSYKQQFINMKHLFDQAKASSRIVNETRRLPPLPETPPKLNRQATAESNIFPHASMVPSISEQAHALAIYLRNKILTMFPLRQRSGQTEPADSTPPTLTVPTRTHSGSRTNLIVFGEDDITRLREESSPAADDTRSEKSERSERSNSSGDLENHNEPEPEPTIEPEPETHDHIKPTRQTSSDAFEVFNDITFDDFNDEVAAAEQAKWRQPARSRPEDRTRSRKKKTGDRKNMGSSPVDLRQKQKTPKFRKSRYDTSRHDTTRHDTTRHEQPRHDRTRHESASPGRSSRGESPPRRMRKPENEPKHSRHGSVPLPDEEKAQTTNRRNKKNGHGPSTSMDVTRRMASPNRKGAQNGRTNNTPDEAPPDGGWDKEWPDNPEPKEKLSNGSGPWTSFTNDNSPFKEDHNDLGDLGELSLSEDEELNERAPHSSADDELEWEDLTIGDRIGIGGFAEVFKGSWCGGDVAIKRLIHQKQTPETLEEFRAEVAIMRKLQHPNITMFMGACTVPPFMTLVTELLEMSLFDLLHNTSIALSWRIKLKIAAGTARGLDFLHNFEQPIVHRDLKSANILLDKHFGPRLADFGLSRIKATNYTMTAQTGTFQWMSPEVIAGKRYTEKADVFSFGIILWELCMRKIPYEGLNGYQVSIAVVTKKIRPKIDTNLIPDDWAGLMQACWQEEPSKRPSVREIARTVDQMQRDYERSHPRS